MWHYCWAHPNDEGGHCLYTISADGVHWQKPSLSLLPWKVTGTTSNNIIKTAGSVMYIPNAPDPARRYQSVSAGQYLFSGSPDGLRWERLSKETIFSAGDTGHVMGDPLIDKSRGYAKAGALVAGQRRRAIGYSEGTDFGPWPPMRLIIAPDDYDDRWVRPGSVQRTHFYNCPVFSYQDHSLARC